MSGVMETQTFGTATLIDTYTTHVGAAQRTYRLDPPMEALHEYVVVSAVVAPVTGPETYIFEGDADGNVTDWGELPGSFRGDFDHERALRNAGYEVKP